MRFSLTLAIFFAVAVLLFLQPTWSSTLFRVTSSSIDFDLWNGLISQIRSQQQQSAYDSDEQEEQAALTKADISFPFKPTPLFEVHRRRFMFMDDMRVQTIQHFLFHTKISRSILEIIFGISGKTTFGMKEFLTFNENGIQLLSSTSTPKQQEEVPQGKNKFIAIKYKIYDSHYKTQLAPTSEYHPESWTGDNNLNEKPQDDDDEADREKQTKKRFERPTSLNRNKPPKSYDRQAMMIQRYRKAKTADEANTLRLNFGSKEEITKSELLPGMKELILNALTDDGGEIGSAMIRARIHSTKAFGRRGFPLWNILPHENIIVEMEIVQKWE